MHVLLIFTSQIKVSRLRVALAQTKQLQSSVKAKGRAAPDADDSSKYLSESQVAKMSLKGIREAHDEIFEAQRSGKFIYDMSKK